jgi:hypothetical protein
MSSYNNAVSFLLVSLLRQRKANFSRRQNVLLIVRSQYRYKETSKILQPNEVPSKIYFISHPYYVENKYDPHINNSLTPRTKSAPQKGRPKNLWFRWNKAYCSHM